jgi:hypothetical protein
MSIKTLERIAAKWRIDAARGAKLQLPAVHPHGTGKRHPAFDS